MSNPDLFANEDQAEKGFLASVESRRSNGERPPLGNASVAFDKIFSAMHDSMARIQRMKIAPKQVVSE
jgi:hypothetical protein